VFVIAPLNVTAPVARRFQRRALGLDKPHDTVGAALAHHGYVQIDPINVCGRMHDLILRNRVAGYREGDLFRHLHGAETPLRAGERSAFEHHLPSTNILVALTADAWPHLRAAMRARSRRAGPWSGRLSPREKTMARRVLAEIAARGPLASDDFDDPGRTTRLWGSATLVKAVMQKLFFHGELLIAGRENGRRRYDLPERVLDSSLLKAPEPSREETARWETLLKLRQRRLVALKRAELPLVADAVVPVRIDDGPVVHLLAEDLPLLEAAASRAPEGPPLLLAPLDPLIYDRVLTRRVWAFAYTWEVYTPPAKRVRGYYALPVLAGDRLVGHVDPKADRTAGRLRIVGRRVAKGHAVAPAVGGLAAFLGLKS
jgi:uncharacterized protein YcaQ